MSGVQPVGRSTRGVGFTSRQVKVDDVVFGRNVAICIESATGHKIEVPLLPIRVRVPKAGETWLIDRDFGNWSFAALLVGTLSSGGGGGEPFVYTSTGWGDILVPTPFTFAAPYPTMPVMTYGYTMGNAWTANSSDIAYYPLPRCYGGVASWVMSGSAYAGANVFVAVDSVGIEAVQVHHNFVFQAGP